jgi:hypothetical protein
MGSKAFEQCMGVEDTNRHERKASKVQQKRLGGVLSLASIRAETSIYIRTIRTADTGEGKGGSKHHLEIIPLPQGSATHEFLFELPSPAD